MAKRNSKLNLGYFCSLKNIVPIILVAIIVFFVFNLLQNKSFNPLFEGMDAPSLDGKIEQLELEISKNINEHEKDHKIINENVDHNFDYNSTLLDDHKNGELHMEKAKKVTTSGDKAAKAVKANNKEGYEG